MKLATREKPILFSAPMVRAILDGRKTMTRRIITRLSGIGPVTEFQPSDTPGYDWTFRNKRMLWNDLTNDELLSRAPYRVGDVPWVKENFWVEHDCDGEDGQVFDCGINLKEDTWAAVQYCATPNNPDRPDEPGCWFGPDEVFNERSWLPWGENGIGPRFFSKRSLLFMPRWASRIDIEILAVRAERLQDITEADAVAEGFERREHFIRYWDTLQKPGNRFDDNPWDWVYTFKRIKP